VVVSYHDLSHGNVELSFQMAEHAPGKPARALPRMRGDDDLARLSPLQHEHVLMLGTFPFTLPHELAAGHRRALRAGDDRPT